MDSNLCKQIYTKLNDRNPGLIIDSCCHRAAVCIPLIEEEDGFRILFEQRCSNLEDQPGDICFPGGMMENGEDPRETAVRECCEELLIEKNRIEVLGPSDIFTSFNVVVYPYAVVLHDYENSFSRDEVAEVFKVPLEFFMNNEPEVHTIEWKSSVPDDFPFGLVQGGRNYKWRRQLQEQPFYHYKDKVIWGMTAKIVRAFSKIMNYE